MSNTEIVWRLVERRAASYFEMSDRIWEEPEVNFQETRAATRHAAMLAAEGFGVQHMVAGMPTAVMGEAGDGGPVIAILGE